MASRLLGGISVSVFTLGIFTSANAALVDNGGGLIYDTVLDIGRSPVLVETGMQ